MINVAKLEINEIHLLTDDEMRDVVAHYTNKPNTLSQREADMLTEAESALTENEIEYRDYWNDVADDVEADADALVSAGMGTDEDYGYYGGDEY